MVEGGFLKNEAAENKLSYRLDVDGLRGLAIIAVVLYHCLPTYFPGGLFGVDVFFVLSGYLITRIIWKDLTNQKFSLANFYIRRIIRIFPALLLVLAFSVVAGWLLIHPKDYASIGKYVFFSSFFGTNFLLHSEQGYFAYNSAAKPLSHLWSLAVEEQYYLVIPFLLIAVQKTKLNALKIHAFFVLGLFIVAYKVTESNPNTAFLYPNMRAWELLIGGSLAILELAKKAPRLIKSPLGNGAAVLGISLVCISIVAADGEGVSGFIWRSIVVAGTSLLILQSGAPISKYALENQPITFIGKISYPLYLWHYLLFGFERMALPPADDRIFRMFAVVMVSVLLSALTYQYLEKRIKSIPKIWIILLFSLPLVGGLGYLVHRNNGYPNRLEQDKNDLNSRLSWDSTSIQELKECKFESTESEWSYCLESINPSVALVGDSHVIHLVSGIRKAKDPHFRNISLYAKASQCFYTVTPGCSNFQDEVIQRLNHNPTIKTIIFSVKRDLNNQSPENLKLQMEFVDKLLKRGLELIVIGDNPQVPFDPELCAPTNLTLRKFLMDQAKCEGPLRGIEESESVVKGALLQFEEKFKNSKKLSTFDLRKAICPSGVCKLKENDYLLYSDADHISRYGSKIVAEKLILEYRDRQKNEEEN